MRVQSARALLSILRFCSELFSLLSGALMGFSTRPTLIMKTVEAASIHPSIAQEPLDSCRARLINGRHSRSLPFGAGRELKNSALEHLTLPATSASFGAFLPPGPEVPSRKVAAGGLSAIEEPVSPRGSNRIQGRPHSVGLPTHEPNQRASSFSEAHSHNEKQTRARHQQSYSRVLLEEQPRHPSSANH